MRLIAHRGNIDGPDTRENSPAHIMTALEAGFDVEMDVSMNHGALYAGHDRPDHYLANEFETHLLLQPHLPIWFHAKDIESLHALLRRGLHCFFHGSDDVTLTSRGYMWTYPKKLLTPLSVQVMPESLPTDVVHGGVYGVCSDVIADIEQHIRDNPPLKR